PSRPPSRSAPGGGARTRRPAGPPEGGSHERPDRGTGPDPARPGRCSRERGTGGRVRAPVVREKRSRPGRVPGRRGPPRRTARRVRGLGTAGARRGRRLVRGPLRGRLGYGPGRGPGRLPARV